MFSLYDHLTSVLCSSAGCILSGWNITLIVIGAVALAFTIVLGAIGKYGGIYFKNLKLCEFLTLPCCLLKLLATSQDRTYTPGTREKIVHGLSGGYGGIKSNHAVMITILLTQQCNSCLEIQNSYRIESFSTVYQCAHVINGHELILGPEIFKRLS